MEYDNILNMENTIEIEDNKLPRDKYKNNSGNVSPLMLGGVIIITLIYIFLMIYIGK